MQGPRNRRAWTFSRGEVRVALTALAVAIWTYAAYDVLRPGPHYQNGTPKGGDFAHFFVLGHAGANGRGDILYDAKALKALQDELVPGFRHYRFIPIYGLQTALLFAPLAALPFASAALVWAGTTIAVFVGCVFVVWNRAPVLSPFNALRLPAALALVPLYSLTTAGQTSILPLVCLTAGYLALRAGRTGWAGFALGSMVVKPQYGVAVAGVAILCREWRIVLGAAAGIALQWGISAAVFGPDVLPQYFNMLLRGPALASKLEPNLAQFHSLRAFWVLLLFPTSAVLAYLLSGAAVLAAAVRLWRSGAPLEYRYSGLVIATVLCSPHMGAYDLVILAPAFVLTAVTLLQYPRAGGVLGTLLVLCFIAPFTGAFTKATHLQLTVPALVTWMLALYQDARRHAVRPPDSIVLGTGRFS